MDRMKTAREDYKTCFFFVFFCFFFLGGGVIIIIIIFVRDSFRPRSFGMTSNC